MWPCESWKMTTVGIGIACWKIGACRSSSERHNCMSVEQPVRPEDTSNALESKPAVWVGLVPSPVHCEHLVSVIKDDLPGILRDKISNDVTWRVEAETDPLTGTRVNIDDLLQDVDERKERAGWTYAIAVSDLPVRYNNHIVLAEGRTSQNIAMLSVVAMGAVRVTSRIPDHIVALLKDMGAENDGNGLSEDAGSRAHSAATDTDIDINYAASQWLGVPRLLAGMVYANRPGRLFPSFKTTIAAAFAAGGYGLAFTTLWQLGSVYGYLRLITLMLIAMTVLVGWIILTHGLWESGRAEVSRFDRSLYNAATIATIASGVVFAYIIVFVLLLLAAVVYIPTSMLESTIGQTPTPITYVRVAWVTSSVATIAGAIGAGLENSEAVRNATFGWRQLTRWKQYDKEGSDGKR